jgi:hypothetical protein
VAPNGRLLTQTFVVVVVVRLGLWLLPFQVLRSWLIRLMPTVADEAARDPAAVDRVAVSVGLISPFVPRAHCLTQALATQALIARRGCSSRLCIGVAKAGTTRFKAHAWVEHLDRIVIGGTAEQLADYSLVASLGWERPREHEP